jgi:ribosomal-protein-alanine N-acetyltransferase
MNVQFRKMNPSDVDQVYRLERELFEDPWPRDGFLKDLHLNSAANAFVLTDGDVIIAYSVCWYFVQELHIGNLAVSRQYQRKGYGSFMLSKLLAEFPDSNLVYLEVRISNKVAIKLYYKFGFKELYRRKSYYRNGEDALILVKNKEDKNGLV